MFGGWKKEIKISGKDLEIHHTIEDEKKLIIAKGKIELKKTPTGVVAILEDKVLILKPTTDINIGDVFKWIEEITST